MQYQTMNRRGGDACMTEHANIKGDDLIPSGIYEDEEARKKWIKLQLRMRSETFSSVAEKNGATRQALSGGLSRGSYFWQTKVAEVIGFAPEKIWPECYQNGVSIK